MANVSDWWTKLGLNKPSATDWEEHSAVGDVSTGRRFKAVQEVPFTTRVDEVDASNTYVGVSKPGTATSSALWRIQKIAVSGTVTTISFADGNDAFDNVWDDRASLTYS